MRTAPLVARISQYALHWGEGVWSAQGGPASGPGGGSAPGGVPASGPGWGVYPSLQWGRPLPVNRILDTRFRKYYLAPTSLRSVTMSEK